MGRAILRAAVLALGLWCIWNGAQRFLLLVAGTAKMGRAENVAPTWGARNRVYRVQYVFEQDGKEWRGVASALRQIAPGSHVPVRYWSTDPAIHDVDSRGALILWAIVWAVPGAILVVLGARMRGTPRRRTG
jgi:hypothetical protein